MATDIFNRTMATFGGSFAADEATLTFPQLNDGSGAYLGLLVQQMTVSYQQQVTRLYEVGQPTIYYVGGRTAGSASLSRVIGPKTLTNAFYQTYGDLCRAAQNTLQFSIDEGCDSSATPVSYVAFYICITAIGLGVAAADMLISETCQMFFSSFVYSSPSGD